MIREGGVLSMNQEEEKQIHSDDNQDRLTSFMLGGKRGRKEEEKKIHPHPNKGDWILGSKFRGFDEREDKKNDSTLSNLLNQVDIEELYRNLDMLMETAGQFKPLWKQISPLIQKWKK